MSSPETLFERCEQAECVGARIEGRHCLEHVTAEELDVAVQRFRAGEAIDARYTTLSGEQVQALLEALTGEAGLPLLPEVNFSGATFSGDTDFDGATFGGCADFYRATFSGDAGFNRAIFNSNAAFNQATFRSNGRFRGAVFGGYARFRGVAFGGYAAFNRATFSSYADFDRAIFSDYAGFRATTFVGHGGFRAASFAGHADFDAATFNRIASFSSAAFERAGPLGPLVVGERLVLDDCVFAERISIEVATIVMSARATKFVAGAHLRVRWAEIVLDDADFARASTLSGATTWSLASDVPPACIADGRRIELEPRPRLITLRGAHVTELSLSDIDLRSCRFFGAHGLESLSIETSCRWPHTPPLRRYSNRETIAEEHQWRGSSWEDPCTQAPEWLFQRREITTEDQPALDEEEYWRGSSWEDPSTQATDRHQRRGASEQLQANQIAALYRALRKAREDDKDQAGASDLYYGEMEMRRHTARTGSLREHRARTRADHAILTLYWLTSGYGLKASRALTTLTIIVVLASLGLRTSGFTPDPPYPRAMLYSIESTSSLLRAPQAPRLQITYAGEGIQIALRILGPLLIGLALLAVRARVKR